MDEEELIRIIAYTLHVCWWGDEVEDQIDRLHEVLDLKVDDWVGADNVRITWKQIWEAEIHDGDCTNQPQMCLLCKREEFIEAAERVLKEFKSYG